MPADDREYGTGCCMLIVLVGTFLMIGAGYIAFLVLT